MIPYLYRYHLHGSNLGWKIGFCLTTVRREDGLTVNLGKSNLPRPNKRAIDRDVFSHCSRIKDLIGREKLGANK